jgi:hypothetical protein
MALDPRNNTVYMNPTTVEGDHWLGEHFMKRGLHKPFKLVKNSPGDMKFHAFYGAPAIVVLNARHTLVFHALLPNGGWFFHFLWALIFMKLYGTEPDGSCRAVDPNTFRKAV